MKRVRRIAFHGLAALSALLCAATMVLWVRSYSRIDRFDYVHPPSRHVLNTGRGYFDIEVETYEAYRALPRGLTWTTWSGAQSATQQLIFIELVNLNYHARSRFFGFSWGPASVWTNIIAGPIWSLTLATAMFPTCWLIHYRRRLSRRRLEIKGICPKCGYDLRATPNHCPECGAVPARKNKGFTLYPEQKF